MRLAKFLSMKVDIMHHECFFILCLNGCRRWNSIGCTCQLLPQKVATALSFGTIIYPLCTANHQTVVCQQNWSTSVFKKSSCTISTALDALYVLPGLTVNINTHKFVIFCSRDTEGKVWQCRLGTSERRGCRPDSATGPDIKWSDSLFPLPASASFELREHTTCIYCVASTALPLLCGVFVLERPSVNYSVYIIACDTIMQHQFPK